MKKLLVLLLILSLLVCTGCSSFKDKFSNRFDIFGKDDEVTDEDTNNDTGSDKPTDKPNGSEEKTHKYLDFSSTEKNLFTRYIGAQIPFIPCDVYYVEGLTDDSDYENGINFYTEGNTQAEFDAYRESFKDYTLTETYTGTDGSTWYEYKKDDVVVKLSFDGTYVDVYVTSSLSNDPEDKPDGPSVNPPVTNTKEDEWRKNYSVITVAEALSKSDSYTEKPSDERFYIIATIVEISNEQYGEMTVKDSTGEIYVYGADSADGNTDYGKLSSKPAVGDVVLFYATLKNHNGLREIHSAWIIDFYTPGGSSDGPSVNPPATNTKEDEWRKNYNVITVAEALTKSDSYTEKPSDERFYIIATIVEISNEQYGEMTVKDSTGEIYVYGADSADGSTDYGKLSSKPAVGDVVLFYATLKNHNGLREIHSGWIIDFYTPNGNSGNTGTGSGSGSGSGSTDTTHTYNDFTADEKALMNSVAGLVIPFAPNNQYFVDEYTYDYDDGTSEHGVNFFSLANTQAEFNAYLALFSSYTNDGTQTDDYGDVWYFFSKGDVCVDISYYACELEDPAFEGYIIDVYVYIVTEDSGNSGNTGTGSGSGGNTADSNEEAWREAHDVISVAEGLDICEQTGSTKTEEQYYVIATIVSIDDLYYGNMTVKDATGQIYVYGTYGADGKDRYGELTVAVPNVGDVVLFYTKFVTYEGTPEMTSSWIIDFYTPNGNSGNTGTGSGSGSGSGSTDTTHTYNDFTADEKALLNSVTGLVIPFAPNNQYFVEEYTYDYDDGTSEHGVNFFSLANTQAEFNAYLALFSSYTNDGTQTDDYGDVWYFFSKGDVCVDISYYEYQLEDPEFEGYIIDVYVYIVTEDNGNSGNTGTGSGSGSTTDPNVITNAGAGLPESNTGIYDVDFTTATNVKDVTDQGYYLDGCPTTGSPAVLVIPVEFSNSLASSKGYTTDALVNAFGEGGDVDYYSVHDYYYISSYNQLDLDITVLDFWFKPQYDSNYYYNATYDYSGSEIAIGDQLILDEALAYLEGIMDLSAFDSDNNGTIDAVVLVNTLEIGEEDFFWAYRYWNVYTDDEGYYFEYDGVSANDYIWASYQFLYESYDADGNVTYEDASVMNTYTFIHEFGHILGADDYYDTTYVGSPMGGADIMDSSLGDQNAYTKFNFGWITTSKLIVTDSSVTVNLGDFSKTGETLIIANNWSDELGAYQEYYVIAYYTNKGLNDNELNYFQRDGVVVYHVNASLYSEDYDGEIYYDVYNNNTDASDEYGTEDNLIEYVKTASDTYTYVVGDTLPALTDDLGNALGHTFVIDALTEEYATITFTVV